MNRSAVLSGAVVVCAVAAIAIGGDLTPPPAPITSTMKTLDAIEPRICVNDLPGTADAVHEISQSGNYYLTGDITGEPGKHGIQITGENVTLDLNGFSLHGVAGSKKGISGNYFTPLTARVIFTGHERVGGSVIHGFGEDGIFVDGATSVSIDGITVENNGGNGLDVELLVPSTGNFEGYVSVSGVVVQSNGGHGVRIGAPLAAAATAKVFCADVRSCMNGLDGIRAEDLDSITLRNVQCISNGEDGVDATLVSRNATEGFLDISVSLANDNGGNGVIVRAVPDASGALSYDKMFSVGVTACGNGLDGIHTEDLVGATFERCDTAGNAGAGFYSFIGPGVPIFRTVAFLECSATNNDMQGVSLVLPEDSGIDLQVDGGLFSENGDSDAGIAAAGFDVDTSGGVSDPLSPSTLNSNFDGATFSGNSGDGLRIKTPVPWAEHNIQGVRARGNDGNGVNVGPDDVPAGAFDIAVNFEDIFCSLNGADGARVNGGINVEHSEFRANIGNAIAISGFPGSKSTGAHCRMSDNGGGGLVIEGADTGGAWSNIIANGNGGTGISIGGSGIPGFATAATGLRVDECFASHNDTGIVVLGENIVLRSGGSHNTTTNLDLGPAVFAGPSTSNAWSEVKPYAWP